jgi:hypothetical protein
MITRVLERPNALRMSRAWSNSKPETRNLKPEMAVLVSGFWFLVSIFLWLCLSLRAVLQLLAWSAR